MADPKGFLRHGREVAVRRPIDERVRDRNEVYPDGIGRALLPIPDRLHPFLRYAYARRSSDTGPVLHRDGKPLGSIKTSWRNAVTRAKLPGVTAQVEGRVEGVERGFRYRPVLRVAIGDDARGTLVLRFFRFRPAQVGQFTPGARK